MEEEDPKEEPDEEDSRDDMRESDLEGERREAPEGEAAEIPAEEPVVAPIEDESVSGVQAPILPSGEELGHEEGDPQSRDVHMIIPSMFEPLSPFFSPLRTVSDVPKTIMILIASAQFPF